MTINDARILFKLPVNFTEHELSAAYHALSRKYHPNYNPSNGEEHTPDEEMFKKVNEANEILQKYYFPKERTTSFSEGYDAFNLRTYRAQKKAELLKMAEYDENEKHDNYFINIVSQIKNIANDFEYLSVTYSKKAGVDSYFNISLKKIKSCYDELKKFVYKEEYVDETKFSEKEMLNYALPIGEFYRQLMKIKYCYSKKLVFESRAKSEIAQYENLQGYNRLSTLIEIAYNRAQYNAEQNRYDNIDDAIKKMHEEINNLFAIYHRILEKINFLNDYFAARFGEDNINKLYDLSVNNLKEYSKRLNISIKWLELYLNFIKEKQSYERGNALATSENNLDALKDEINRYEIIEKEKPLVNQLYQSIVSKMSLVLSSMDSLEDFEKKQDINSLFTDILQVFLKYEKGEIDFDSLTKLESISFMDPPTEKILVQEVLTPIKTDKVSSDIKIYIRESDPPYYGLNQFYVNSGDNLYCVGPQMVSEDKNNLAYRKMFYKSLDSFLEFATFVGCRGEIDVLGEHRPIYVLYKLGKYYIYEIDGEINICFDQYGYTIWVGKYEIPYDIDNKYRNKEEFKAILTNQIARKIQEFEDTLQEQDNIGR